MEAYPVVVAVAADADAEGQEVPCPGNSHLEEVEEPETEEPEG